MTTRHARLEDVILDDLFPEVDVALRRGRHIDRDDADEYAFISDAQDHLEPLYRRYGCELVHKSEGYFYLLPTAERFPRRFLSPTDMLVGQTMTLLYLDPSTLQSGGVVTRDHVLGHLAGVMGAEALVRAVNPKRKKIDPSVAEETVRTKVAESIRRLAGLGFVEMVDEASIRLRPALMRFAEPVRGNAAPEEVLEKLVAQGEVVLTDGAETPEDEGDGDAGPESAAPAPMSEPPAEPSEVEAEEAEPLPSDEGPVDEGAVDEAPVDEGPADEAPGDDPFEDAP